MNREKAYINGFIKRASEYGYSEAEAMNIYKEAGALTTLSKMEASGVDPRLLKRILASRKQVADDIRYSRNTANAWGKSQDLQEAYKNPAAYFLDKENSNSISRLKEDLRGAMEDIYHASPKNISGKHLNVLSPELEREAMTRLRPHMDLPMKIYENVERKLY
jgi:hypothetical protein